MHLIPTDKIPWAPDLAAHIKSSNVLRGPSDGGLGGIEIVVGEVDQAPSRALLQSVHSKRQGRRNADVVVALSLGGQVWVYGPDTGRAPIVLSVQSAERQLQAALNEPNSFLAYRRLAGMQDAAAMTEMPGVRNRGLFASYHLRENVAKGRDWSSWNQKARTLIQRRHRDLISGLGFMLSSSSSESLLLTTPGQEARAVAILLEQDEGFESASDRFQRSPVSIGLSVAHRVNVPWLILLRGDQIRLYPAKDNVGVGQAGQVETYFELDLAAISEEHVGFLPLVFSAESLASEGMTERLLADSAKFASALGIRLRERVYGQVVPTLATEVAHQLRTSGREIDSAGLDFAYRTTLTVLFRLLFQAYAEDRGLLPAGRNEAYDANSLKTLGTRLLRDPDQEFGEASAIWRNLKEVWNSIDKGNPQYELPAYNGGLFATDDARHPEGAFIEQLDIPDTVMGPTLRAMLIDATAEGIPGLVDFRSLSVREFGTIYEGLLESSLSLADQDLSLDKKGAWIPVADGVDIVVPEGEPYFHNSSGERKATGSYFTPSFIVDYLIERSVDPTLNRHLGLIRGLVESGKSQEAARDFFDYRLADLAMGSGHFLVAAVDRIESRMRDFLAEPGMDIPGVNAELARLAHAAKEALGRDEAAFQEIEQATLLRRQIARRCVYGIDINPLAVELSRLALWIHTFVPGLPMSTLDHNLVCANSLTGIGTVDEAKKVLDFDALAPGDLALFGSIVDESLAKARDILVDVAHLSEATKAEAKEVQERLEQAKQAAEPTRKIFDAAVAVRTGKAKGKGLSTEEELIDIADAPEVRELIAKTNPAHMPYLFPEVFLRPNGGFDVLVGNPPWEKLHVEEHQWWGLRSPGLRGLPMARRGSVLAELRRNRPDLEEQFQLEVLRLTEIRRVVHSGPFPGLGSAHIDLYQAFSWRNWQLVRDAGRFGLVLPRGALSGSAMAAWRREILEEGSFAEVCFATNTGHWMFDSVHAQYTVGLTTVAREKDTVVRYRGPFHDLPSFLVDTELAEVSATEFGEWSPGSAFPLIPSRKSTEVFRQCQLSPKFGHNRDDFEFRPVQGDLNASSDKELLTFSEEFTDQSIPVLGGSSFNIWDPDAGPPYAHADSSILRSHLGRKLRDAVTSQRSAYFGKNFEEGTVPLDSARIAFRDVTNQTNTRTTIVCLLPPGSSVTHKAPVLVRRRGNPSDEAFVLGVMSSVPFDWGARRVVELTLSFEILNTLPVPFAPSDSILRSRVVSLSGRLAAVDSRFSTWAAAVGVPVGSVETEQEKEEVTYELDALVSLLYGLNEQQVVHIFETFHRGWNYQPRLSRVLDYFAQWKDKA